MPAKRGEHINVFEFRSSVERIRDAHEWLTDAIARIRKVEALSDELRASSGGPGKPIGSLLDLITTWADSTHYEVIARATYVYAWAVFTDHLAECVELVYARHPERLIMGIQPERDFQVVKRLLKEQASPNEIVGDLVTEAVNAFRKGDYPGVPKFFIKRLGVEWKPAWSEALARPHQRRTDAAHSKKFKVPALEEVREDLDAIIRAGTAIARAVGERHQVSVRMDSPYSAALLAGLADGVKKRASEDGEGAA